MAYTEAQKNAVKKYNEKAYDEIKLRVRAGNKDIILAHAKAEGKTVNTFINDLLEEKIPEFKSQIVSGDIKNLERFKKSADTASQKRALEREKGMTE